MQHDPTCAWRRGRAHLIRIAPRVAPRERPIRDEYEAPRPVRGARTRVLDAGPRTGALRRVHSGATACAGAGSWCQPPPDPGHPRLSAHHVAVLMQVDVDAVPGAQLIPMGAGLLVLLDDV